MTQTRSFPRFITLEGIEGAGKTTLVAEIGDELSEWHCPWIATREPGGAPTAERIRAVLLDPEQRELCAAAELLLMFAARADHLHQTIMPALAAGTWVVCDRFVDASYAYQGGGRGIPWSQIDQVAELVLAAAPRPDLTLLLDVPVEIGLTRAKRRAQPFDRIETEDHAFFIRVRQAYLDRAAREPHRFRVLDASRPFAEVSATARAWVRELLVASTRR